MSAEYELDLDDSGDRVMYAQHTTRRRDVIDYAVILMTRRRGEMHTVRVYDSAHGVNEMHRHTCMGGKQPAEAFHRGTLGEGMRAATDQIKRSHLAMIEAWEAG